MKSFLTMAFSLLILQAVAHANPARPFKVTEIGVMQQNADGTYSVVCANGNRELVTDLDLKLNNVCPHQTSTTPTNILSVQKRTDGNFDVVCNDMSKIVSTAEEILSGKVCAGSTAPVVLTNGIYKVVSGNTNYCPQRVTTQISDGNLVGLRLEFLDPCSAAMDFTCRGLACRGDYSGQPATLDVIDSTHYDFDFNGDGHGTFVYSP